MIARKKEKKGIKKFKKEEKKEIIHNIERKESLDKFLFLYQLDL